MVPAVPRPLHSTSIGLRLAGCAGLLGAPGGAHSRSERPGGVGIGAEARSNRDLLGLAGVMGTLHMPQVCWEQGWAGSQGVTDRKERIKWDSCLCIQASRLESTWSLKKS